MIHLLESMSVSEYALKRSDNAFIGTGNGTSAGFWKTHLAISGQGVAYLRHSHQTFVHRVTNYLVRVVSRRLRLSSALPRTYCVTQSQSSETQRQIFHAMNTTSEDFEWCGYFTEHSSWTGSLFKAHPIVFLCACHHIKGVLVFLPWPHDGACRGQGLGTCITMCI